MDWINLSVACRATVFPAHEGHGGLNLVVSVGIEGDRNFSKSGFYFDRPEEGQQITLFEEETLVALKRDYGIDLAAQDHRRNITTRDVTLNHLVGETLEIGECLLEFIRLSTPCRHIEQITGKGIFEPLLHRFGLHARILCSGIVRIGDMIKLGKGA